eukprot:8048298-Alexandrium_andersonii.AAC.1
MESDAAGAIGSVFGRPTSGTGQSQSLPRNTGCKSSPRVAEALACWPGSFKVSDHRPNIASTTGVAKLKHSALRLLSWAG